jgi:hypothetical protein
MPSRLGSVFMLRHVAKIYMYFQGSPFVISSSTQHECNMTHTRTKIDHRKASSLGLLTTTIRGGAHGTSNKSKPPAPGELGCARDFR